MGDLVKTPHSEITATLEILARWGVRTEHLDRFRAASSFVQQMIAQAIIICDETFFANSKAASIFKVVVDYGKSLNEMIDAGKYDFANRDINSKNFPIDGKGCIKVDIELIHFGRNTKSNEAIRELDKMSYRPATLVELLVFGATYPEKQKEFLIIALGSVWLDRAGDRYVPYLSRWGSARELGLSCFDDGWNDDCRFAAVRK